MKIFLPRFAKELEDTSFLSTCKDKKMWKDTFKPRRKLLCLIFLPVGKSLWPFLYLTFVHLNNIHACCHKRHIRKKRCSPPPQIVPASDVHQQPLPETIAKYLADVRNEFWLTWSQIVGSASTPFLLPLSCPQNPSSLSGSRCPQG